ncbi:hypothetical protein ILUMI_02088 [Ignelater luminosus]|uniref:Fibronectin type-III domain-containing protein n=1 Tax=Ignelater luminosus TaxID=2038154 RepID=A0A8K0DD76_IGNLU|nr:hypothetical protein ILUMI_02088 [Ignelater luminosus]
MDITTTSSTENIVLRSLKKYIKYTVQVLAYTSVGDGVRSDPIQCQTEQEVQYTIYVTQAGLVKDEDVNSNTTRKTTLVRLNGNRRSLQIQKLDPKYKYEFAITASTAIGEGSPSKSVMITPSSRASGIKGIASTSNDRIKQQPDGSLLLLNVIVADVGEYSCQVGNSFGQDSITDQLIVNSPPLSPDVISGLHASESVKATLPLPPNVIPIAYSYKTLTLKIQPNVNDTEPVTEYNIFYRHPFGKWETAHKKNIVDYYTINDLSCGTPYKVYVTASNSLGTGDRTDIIDAKTSGESPELLSSDKLIKEVSSNEIGLNFDFWPDGGCPILYFVIEYKETTSSEWILLSNNAQSSGVFFISDLKPSTSYQLRISAHNSAGQKTGEYDFVTLSALKCIIRIPKTSSE